MLNISWLTFAYFPVFLGDAFFFRWRPHQQHALHYSQASPQLSSTLTSSEVQRRARKIPATKMHNQIPHSLQKMIQQDQNHQHLPLKRVEEPFQMMLSHVQSHVHSPVQFQTAHLVTARAHIKSQLTKTHFHKEPDFHSKPQGQQNLMPLKSDTPLSNEPQKSPSSQQLSQLQPAFLSQLSQLHPRLMEKLSRLSSEQIKQVWTLLRDVKIQPKVEKYEYEDGDRGAISIQKDRPLSGSNSDPTTQRKTTENLHNMRKYVNFEKNPIENTDPDIYERNSRSVNLISHTKELENPPTQNDDIFRQKNSTKGHKKMSFLNRLDPNGKRQEMVRGREESWSSAPGLPILPVSPTRGEVSHPPPREVSHPPRRKVSHPTRREEKKNFVTSNGELQLARQHDLEVISCLNIDFYVTLS